MEAEGGLSGQTREGHVNFFSKLKRRLGLRTAIARRLCGLA